MKKQQEPFQDLCIPKEVLRDQQLTAIDKLLFCLLKRDHLDLDTEVSNYRLALELGVNHADIVTSISRLEKLKVITTINLADVNVIFSSRQLQEGNLPWQRK